MAQSGRWTGKMPKNLLSPKEILPGKPLVEIYAGQRVLIEYHRGVIRYEGCEIIVKLPEGSVSVEGSNLKLARVSSDQLVICGRISCVRFCGKDG